MFQSSKMRSETKKKKTLGFILSFVHSRCIIEGLNSAIEVAETSRVRIVAELFTSRRIPSGIRSEWKRTEWKGGLRNACKDVLRYGSRSVFQLVWSDARRPRNPRENITPIATLQGRFWIAVVMATTTTRPLRYIIL